jgi:hypothetical protein
MSAFAIQINTITAVASAERAIEGLKGDAKEAREAANGHKITAYSEVIASIASVKLQKGNLPRAVSTALRKALLEDAGIKEATAKRYMENSVGALRELNIPTQATPSLVSDILASENIDSENKLAKRVSGESDKDPMRDLAEQLVGRFTTRKDENGAKVQGVFKPSKFDQADWDRFDDAVRELQAARIAANDAAAAAAIEAERANELANEVFNSL